MTWADDVRRANEALDWIEARQGPLPADGYARIETTVGQVRAMAEGQDDDARGRCFCMTWARTPEMGDDVAGHHPRCHQTYFTKERFDALAAEASDVARENETLIEEVKAAGEQIAALAAERDARIKTLENDLEHALASVGAFRQAIETIFAKAEEHEIDHGGMIVTYALPCGPLHRAIGLARGTDAGGKLLKRLSDTEAERDAAVARAERAEAALPDPGKLWSLATWLDSIYPYDSNPEVQTDLRTWARQIFALGLHNDSWAVEVEVSAALAAASEAPQEGRDGK